MSSPESVSSSTATSGSSSAIWRISLRFFSPPLKPWFRWRLANDGSMPRRSIHSVMSDPDLEHRDLLGALARRHGLAQELGHRHALDRLGVLEGEEEAGLGADVGGPVRHVLAVNRMDPAVTV